jgi:glycosyltransferase involved in cell wall biosynthesis
LDKIDVVHFVTGGFSGATAVARQLVQQANQSVGERHLLVLRKKRQTRAAQLQQLTEQQIPYVVVPGWSHLATIYSLVKLLTRLKPRVLIAHGFSEHLWGRLAAIIAGVPVIIHVEHNSKERYTPMRLWLAKKLAARTRWIVGVSEGVKNSLLELGFPAEKCVFINNGINLSPYLDADAYPYAARNGGIVMIARFAQQKDHLTLLQALALLKQRGLTPHLTLVGSGRARHRDRVVSLSKDLAIADQLTLIEHCADIAALLKQHSILVLSTHYEGFGLALAEGMAAGCNVIGTEVPGVREWLTQDTGGFLVRHKDAAHLADTLQLLLTQTQTAQNSAATGRRYAFANLGMEVMMQQYAALFSSLKE